MNSQSELTLAGVVCPPHNVGGDLKMEKNPSEIDSQPSSVSSFDDIRWFHRIDLGDGKITPGIDDTAAKLERIRLPDDLAGRSVLDVGSWDGFFAFECERRGAQRVCAVDSYCWGEDGWADKSGFDYAKRKLGSKVEERYCEVVDLDPESLGVYDLTLFLGVLYHLEDPIKALRQISAVTRDHLILETKVDLLECRRPAWSYYGGSELNRDPTNWWAPNPPALCAALASVGFRRIEVVSGPKPFWQRLMRRPTRERSWWREFQCCRMAVHAWKS